MLGSRMFQSSSEPLWLAAVTHGVENNQLGKTGKFMSSSELQLLYWQHST